MGEFADGLWMRVGGWACAVLIVGLNVALLVLGA
jgi:Mn2+/Fe2+ NRAMP family transporter